MENEPDISRLHLMTEEDRQAYMESFGFTPIDLEDVPIEVRRKMAATQDEIDSQGEVK